jgi:hypothetical protein
MHWRGQELRSNRELCEPTLRYDEVYSDIQQNKVFQMAVFNRTKVLFTNAGHSWLFRPHTSPSLPSSKTRSLWAARFGCSIAAFGRILTWKKPVRPAACAVIRGDSGRVTYRAHRYIAYLSGNPTCQQSGLRRRQYNSNASLIHRATSVMQNVGILS